MQEETDPDGEWVAALAGVGRTAAEGSLHEAAGERALFRHIAREHQSEGRPSYIEIDAPFELYAITRRLRPRHVVEVGVSSGVSSAYVLEALRRNKRGRSTRSTDRSLIRVVRPAHGPPRVPGPSPRAGPLVGRCRPTSVADGTSGSATRRQSSPC